MAAINEASKCSGPRLAPLPAEPFNRRACAYCYSFLFPGLPARPLGPDDALLGIRAGNGSRIDIYDPDVTNATAVERICRTLPAPDHCERWAMCCRAAATCCTRQLRMPSAQVGTRQCARTWDGFSCWDDSPGGSTLTAQCPTFLNSSFPSHRSVRQCQPNGTWLGNGGNGWTNYTSCLDKQGYLEVMYVGLSCNVVSVLLLIPACAIFTTIRELRRQQRVKLHVNLFVSLALAGVANVLWYMLVHHNLLTADAQSKTVLNHNPVWCRVLSFFKIYLHGTTYFWMFCEGYFLHRLLSKAFEPPKHLIVLYLIGWAMPLLPSTSHAIAMATIDNTSCWMRHIGGLQWLLYTPNLLCLVINMIFLCNILRILLFQLHAHPREPSNFRKGLKAAFMLVPLFGLQLFLTIYRPNPSGAYVKAYEFFSTVINSSQGVLVSIIFCYMNGEVLNYFRKKCPCCRRAHLRRTRAPSTSVTQYTTYEDDRDARSSVRTRSAPSGENGNYEHRDNGYHGRQQEAMEMEDIGRGVGGVKKGGYMAVPTEAGGETGPP